jgi:hypothetical protein
MSFRFILQPVMAMFLAVRDGRRDAISGRAPYLWTILTQPSKRGGRLREGLHSDGRVVVLGVLMDAIYQFISFRALYPVEMLIVVLVLAYLPYVLVRGPTTRIVRWWRQRHGEPIAPPAQGRKQ